MKYKLARPIFTKEVSKVIVREMKKQKLVLSKTTRDNLEELAEVSHIIEERGLPEYLVCKKLPGKLGRGIFLHPEARPILKGEIIASYSGDVSLVPMNKPSLEAYTFAPLEEISLTKKEQAFFDKKAKYHPNRYYSLQINAKKNGNFTRFINHSNKPNVSACMLCVPKNRYGLSPASLEVIYMAKRNIYPGEQLLVCYEDEEETYWGVFKIKPFPMTSKTFTLSPALKVIKKDV